MSVIYAVSDIHGCYKAMLKTLELVDLTDKTSELIFLGDYINRGKESKKTIYYIKELEEKNSQVIVLPGNHESVLLDWLKNSDFEILGSDNLSLDIMKSFYTDEEITKIRSLCTDELEERCMDNLYKQIFISDHNELIDWLEKIYKNKYYETEEQIFVHAGVVEIEAKEELWKELTSDRYYLESRNINNKKFYKDIIVGHTPAHKVAANDNYMGKVYFDGLSHYYIDGDTINSGVVPLLKYNKKSKKYTSYKYEDGVIEEYLIRD